LLLLLDSFFFSFPNEHFLIVTTDLQRSSIRILIEITVFLRASQGQIRKTEATVVIREYLLYRSKRYW
jgi:hypothetical protein